MFFSDPAFDLKLSLNLLGLSLIIALIVWGVSRKKMLALVVFSVLGNLIFLLNIGSFMFDSYNLKWLQILSLTVWPPINIFLIIKYAQIKKNKS